MNDCNHDCDFTDAGTDDPDCDDDGTPDVLVRATGHGGPGGRVGGAEPTWSASSAVHRGTPADLDGRQRAGVLFFTSGGIEQPRGRR